MNKDNIEESSFAEQQALFLQMVDEVLNQTCRQRGYDNILNCISYRSDIPQTALYAEKFRKEGNTAWEWRNKVYSYCYTQLALIQNGQREIPTLASFKTELPTIVWPE